MVDVGVNAVPLAWHQPNPGRAHFQNKGFGQQIKGSASILIPLSSKMHGQCSHFQITRGGSLSFDLRTIGQVEDVVEGCLLQVKDLPVLFIVFDLTLQLQPAQNVIGMSFC